MVTNAVLFVVTETRETKFHNEDKLAAILEQKHQGNCCLICLTRISC